MYYPAIVSPEGTHALIIFPDLPECQVIASVNDNYLKVAQDALVRHLQMLLQDPVGPPQPSADLTVAGAVQPLLVPVPQALMTELEARWSWP